MPSPRRPTRRWPTPSVILERERGGERMAIKWTLFAILLGACGPELHYETLEEDAERLCKNRVTCEQIPNPGELKDRCVNATLDESEIGLEEGSRCANSFSTLLTCLSLLSCEEFSPNWSSNYSKEDNPVDYPCKSEAIDLFRNCDRTWYALNGQS